MKKHDFAKIKQEWDQVLTKHGFKDIEYSSGQLKNYDRRTVGFDNQQIVLNFFLRLDQFMNHYKAMPKQDRLVMSLYSEGRPIPEIVQVSKVSRRKIFYIVERYKKLVLVIDQMIQAEK